MDQKLLKILKTVFFYVGNFAVITAGLLYLILTDLNYGNTAPWLLLMSIFAFGGGICGFFSASFKEKRTIMLILKSAAVALSICLIVFMFVSMGQPPYTTVTPVKIPAAHSAVVISLVVAFVSAPFLALDLAANIFFPEEEE